MATDSVSRWSSVLVVLGVAGTAGWVSYLHALDVVRLAGEAGPAAYAYPVCTDGLVYMSSMVLLSAARTKAPTTGCLVVWAVRSSGS